MPSPLPPSVFIVGSPRSGTSVFYKTLCEHPAFAFTTNLTRRFKGRMGLVRVAELFGAKHRAVEAGALWKAFWPTGERDSDESALTDHHRVMLERMVRSHVEHFRRPVFLNKKPGNALRVRWLAAGLPNAKFVQCVRDGRAVANSILRECKKADKRWSYLGRELWPELGEMDYAAFSGGIWSRLSVLGDQALATLPPERVHTVRYEDFIADPLGVLADIAAFCEIEWGPRFHDIVPRLDDRNSKWKTAMTPEEQAAMLREARPGLEHFGYVDAEGRDLDVRAAAGGRDTVSDAAAAG